MSSIRERALSQYSGYRTSYKFATELEKTLHFNKFYKVGDTVSFAMYGETCNLYLGKALSPAEVNVCGMAVVRISYKGGERTIALDAVTNWYGKE